MRSIILMAAVLLIQQQAFASFDRCQSHLELVCETRFNYPNGSVSFGKSGASMVFDQHDENCFYDSSCKFRREVQFGDVQLLSSGQSLNLHIGF